MNVLGVATLVIAMVGGLGAIIFGFVMLMQLAHRRWSGALKSFAVLIAINIVTVEAANLGVNQWNKAIASRVAREHHNSN
jgi:hypothetical protein